MEIYHWKRQLKLSGRSSYSYRACRSCICSVLSAIYRSRMQFSANGRISVEQSKLKSTRSRINTMERFCGWGSQIIGKAITKRWPESRESTVKIQILQWETDCCSIWICLGLCPYLSAQGKGFLSAHPPWPDKETMGGIEAQLGNLIYNRHPKKMLPVF